MNLFEFLGRVSLPLARSIHDCRIFHERVCTATALVCGLALSTTDCVRGVASTATDAQDGAAHSLYVSTDGWKGGDGTREHPFDLATALARGAAHPGDTVWVHEGTYTGAFVSELTGTAEAPIIVRPLPGDHVVLDSS